MATSSATQLFYDFGVILCLDAPTDATLEFGIDTNSWTTGAQFKGIKLIPPGIHYVFYRYESLRWLFDRIGVQYSHPQYNFLYLHFLTFNLHLDAH